MRILCLMYGLTPREWFCLMGKFLAHGMSATLLMVLLGSVAMAQGGPLVLEREGRVISLVPYAPNIVRVTMSIDKAAARAIRDMGLSRHLQRRDGHTSTTPRGTMCTDLPRW